MSNSTSMPVEQIICRVCGSQASVWAKAVIRNKYEIGYFRCKECQTITTEEPYWLEEAYQSAINQSDTGYVMRNMNMASISLLLINAYRLKGPLLDFGGGYGLITRMLRDKGHEIFLYDPYCSNIFAQSLALENLDGRHFALATCCEVMEHWKEPLLEFRRLAALTDNILVTTVTLPEPPPKPKEWWYYGLEHGQHLTLYSKKGLQYLAKTAGMNLYSNDKDIHFFSRKKHASMIFRVLVRIRLAKLFMALR
jgi:Methyltransferase domain